MQATITTNDVDTLGQLLAQIADLTKRADAIKDAIKEDASAGGDKVREGELFTPSERYVLPGVSRQMTIDMAKRLGITCTAGDIDLFDAANAEESMTPSGMKTVTRPPTKPRIRAGTNSCTNGRSTT